MPLARGRTTFELELDYADWVARAFIDGTLVGETRILTSDPYRVS